MSNENLPATQDQNASGLMIPQSMMQQSKFADDGIHERMSGGGQFLPRVQLTAGLSKLVTKGRARPGEYVLVKGKENMIANFGDNFSCVALAWRPKAIRFHPKTMMFFNPASPGFQEVEREGSKKGAKNWMFGPEYLIYIPSVNELATFHFNNVTLRMRVGEFKCLLGKAATLRVELIETGGNTWHGPVISGCSTPLEGMPPVGTEEATQLFARFQTVIDAFCNPPDEMEIKDEGEDVAPETANAGGEQRDR